jgi:hypothetical protein
VPRVRRAVLALTALLLAPALAAGVLAARGTAATTSGSTISCRRPGHGFTPATATLPSLGRTVQVIQVPRKSDGQIGAGPLTTQGKWLMAMDPQTHPGAHRGSVLLAGHTWPDGSALGNAMLNSLHVGDGIVLTGAHGSRACYVVTHETSYPVDQVPNHRLFRPNGPERVVIVACSGRRLGPGNWDHRTVWIAAPLTPRPAPPAPSSSPTPTPSSGGLLGGLLGGL